MQLRPGIRLVYQVGRVVVQTAALLLDLDDLSGGRISRVFIRKSTMREPRPPRTKPYVRQDKQVYGKNRGVPLHKQNRPMPPRKLK